MINEYYIKRCLQLAKLGLGTTAPNPMVGAVLVYKNTIIGEGFTSPFGGNHAEVNCINSVKDVYLKNISKATLYVSLEPCSHFGKTPPCCNLIVKKGIKKIVIGLKDTHSLVKGNGIQYLKDNDCEVTINVLKKSCFNLNKRFFTFHEKKRPYIILKWAESKDGFIGQLKKEKVMPIWISNKYSQQLTHKFRSEEQAILVGTNTVVSDNPKLNTRTFKGENPIRVILDNNLRIPTNFHVLDQSIQTIIFTSKIIQKNKKNLIFECINFDANIAKQICNVLYKYKVQSVIIEGGRQTLQHFITTNLWDEARVFYGNFLLENGIKAPKLKGIIIFNKKILEDQLVVKINNEAI
ncbi:MAG: bifunctional diaminohydroxyphosphoribosylaminopyrimidine deaminase/5-amino-6-(5-phosphoribosylamino)uracil reductase RibD [Flavobacteriaceae bacterium]|nr:bifunctional diaminohydroxyphosphoribosylaminopyrimidine deaminase/5-amino-6-(5-phosphoribosylamino)uracil reductase RibD [Flavobacteriaceae bacterium]